jgi:hypothetical protein
MATFNSGGPGMGASIDGATPLPCNVRVHQEWLDVSSGLPSRRPDPSWELVDKRGHFHAFTGDGKLPTLAEETVRKPCPGGCDDPDCEGIAVTRYRCRICRKKIQPRWVSVYDNLDRRMPGLKSWSVEVNDLSGAVVPPAVGELVSVKVTSGGRTYFGIGRPYGLTVEQSSGGFVASYTVHGDGELGVRGEAS